MATRRSLWAGLGGLGVAGVVTLAGAQLALAHAAYVRSEPGTGAVIATAPTQVVIWFEQDMFRRAGANTISVVGPDGAAVTTGEAVINDDDRRELSVPLAADLPPGAYTVTWHTLSAEDGDEAEDSFTFTLDPEAAVTSTPMQAPATPTDLPPTAGPATAAPTATPAPAGGLGCGGALAPVIGLAALGLGAQRATKPKGRRT